MSATHNGREVLNGTAYESGERVLYVNQHPVDQIEPDEPKPEDSPELRTMSAMFACICSHADWLVARKLAGHDPRPYSVLAAELGCTRQNVHQAAKKMAKQLGLPMVEPTKAVPHKRRNPATLESVTGQVEDATLTNGGVSMEEAAR